MNWEMIDKLFNGLKTTILGGLLCYVAWWEQGMEEPNSVIVYGGYMFGVLLILSPKKVEGLISGAIKKLISKE